MYLARRLSSVAETSSSVVCVLDSFCVMSEMSEAPMIVSCEKNAIPIARVIIAWNNRIIFAHLM